jgi:Flp pilus assembly protein TadG
MRSSSSTADAARRGSFWRRLAADEGGAALAEMAVLVVPFFVFIALMFEGGRLMWSHQIAVKAVRDGTRYLSRVGDPTDGAAQAQASTLARTGRLSGGTPLMGSWSDASKVQFQVTNVANTGTYHGPNPILVVTGQAEVTVDFPFAPVFQFFAPGTPSTITYEVFDEVRHYGE